MLNKSWTDVVAAVASGDIPWQDVPFTGGTINGNALLITGRGEGEVTIEPDENAASFLDNNPDNRGDYAYITADQLDLSEWTADEPGILLLEICRADAAPDYGTCLGLMFHNAADPVTAAKYAGVWVDRKIDGDGRFWAIDNWGNLGGHSGLWVARQRAFMIMRFNADRTVVHLWEAQITQADGNLNNFKTMDLNASTTQAFDITGGLWVSIIVGSYQPEVPADPPVAHTPRCARWAFLPFGANP